MSNVLHGTGKPRIIIDDRNVLTTTVTSSTSTSVVIDVSVGDLIILDDAVGLVGRMIQTRDASSEETTGVITAFDDPNKTLNVASWTGANPYAGEELTVDGAQIDLPYCQSLVESFEPDFIVHKTYAGRLKYIKRGFWYSAILDYSSYITKDTMKLFRFLYMTQRSDLIFYPRSDNLNISYRCEIDTERFQFAQKYNHVGHKLVRVHLKGLERLQNIELNDLTSTGYGDAPYGGSTSLGYGDVL